MTGPVSTRAPETGRSSLRYLAEIEGPAVRVTLRGRLDVDTVWSFGAELLALIRAGRRHITVDLGQLEHVSTICVGVVNRTVAELKPVDGTLTLCGTDDPLVRRLRAAGLHPGVITHAPAEPRSKATTSKAEPRPATRPGRAGTRSLSDTA